MRSKPSPGLGHNQGWGSRADYIYIYIVLFLFEFLFDARECDLSFLSLVRLGSKVWRYLDFKAFDLSVLNIQGFL